MPGILFLFLFFTCVYSIQTGGHAWEQGYLTVASSLMFECQLECWPGGPSLWRPWSSSWTENWKCEQLCKCHTSNWTLALQKALQCIHECWDSCLDMICLSCTVPKFAYCVVAMLSLLQSSRVPLWQLRYHSTSREGEYHLLSVLAPWHTKYCSNQCCVASINSGNCFHFWTPLAVCWSSSKWV